MYSSGGWISFYDAVDTLVLLFLRQLQSPYSGMGRWLGTLLVECFSRQSCSNVSAVCPCRRPTPGQRRRRADENSATIKRSSDLWVWESIWIATRSNVVTCKCSWAAVRAAVAMGPRDRRTNAARICANTTARAQPVFQRRSLAQLGRWRMRAAVPRRDNAETRPPPTRRRRGGVTDGTLLQPPCRAFRRDN